MAHTWCKKLKEDKGVNACLIDLDEFIAAFLDRFFLLVLKKSMVQDFKNVK